MGGAALHLGNIAEMRTGEGKTLTAVLPAYLNALTGKGVHVVTVNDYLAKRDSEWMGRIHRFLGLEVGVILAQMEPDERRKQYAADITYGTNNEFGFDYLRDNMAWGLEECVQRGHHYAIVDEVDSILIDEARTPLIISGPADQNSRWYLEFAKIAPRLRRGEDGDGDYEVDEKKRTVGILETGVEKVEDWLGIDNLYESVNTPLVSFLNNAIKAKELYKKDKDYVVMNGEVLIVDEFTGRMLHGRRYSEGMHQAIEAKEGVQIKDENQTLATITLQNYFRLYDKLAGMTGTAMTEANEFQQTYKLGVVPIPTNMPMIRADQPDVVYQTVQAKFEALVDDIAERNEAGQPVLVGTTSVEKSELVSKMLKRQGIAHEVLNAKYHEREAAIIAQAGRKGAVTVATNMAGRGTDIMLGGNPEFIADLELHQRGLSPVDTPEDFEAAWPEAVDKAKRAVAEEHEEVVAAGGLYVLGTERHESRRIDNQLRGRSGRQGDPGESRFYLSLEDDLMRMFNADKVAHIMEWLKTPPDVPIESKTVSRSIRSAQTQVEQQNFEIRKDLLKYDDVMNRQRQVIYDERREVLEGADLKDQIRGMIDEVVAGYVAGATGRGLPRGVGPGPALAGLPPALPGRDDDRPGDRGGRRGAGSAVDRPDHRGGAAGRAGRLRAPGRGADPRGHARARAAGRAVGARPQVARAPLRDGLPARGHHPARIRAARPAGGVPARGLRHVQRDDGGHQGGVGRQPVQPPGAAAGQPDRGGGRPGRWRERFPFRRPRAWQPRARRRAAWRHHPRRPGCGRQRVGPGGSRCGRAGGGRRQPARTGPGRPVGLAVPAGTSFPDRFPGRVRPGPAGRPGRAGRAGRGRRPGGSGRPGGPRAGPAAAAGQARSTPRPATTPAARRSSGAHRAGGPDYSKVGTERPVPVRLRPQVQALPRRPAQPVDPHTPSPPTAPTIP